MKRRTSVIFLPLSLILLATKCHVDYPEVPLVEQIKMVGLSWWFYPAVIVLYGIFFVFLGRMKPAKILKAVLLKIYALLICTVCSLIISAVYLLVMVDVGAYYTIDKWLFPAVSFCILNYILDIVLVEKYYREKPYFRLKTLFINLLFTILTTFFYLEPILRYYHKM